jgi:crotonobetainyl-CoA:carnitine CoA-transferase CaiB-like acyl-CoA transferase
MPTATQLGALLGLVEEWTSLLTGAEPRPLSRHGVPCALYRGVDEVLADPQLAARDAFAEIHDGAGPIASPIRLSA